MNKTLLVAIAVGVASTFLGQVLYAKYVASNTTAAKV